MAENTQSEGVTIPVVVGKGSYKDAANIKHSKKSVLFINNLGQFHMLPEDLALNKQKNHKGNIIEKSHKDYLRGYKAAIGYDEKIGTKKVFQKNGVVTSIEDMSRMDMEEMVRVATAESLKAKKEAEGK